MQKMPGHGDVHEDAILLPEMPASSLEISDDWRCGLPTLVGSLVTLREMRTSDAPSLLIAMAADEVTRFISPPPVSIEGFEKFIAWTHRQRVRRSGRVVCDRVARFRYRGRPLSDSIARAGGSAPRSGVSRWRPSSGAPGSSATARGSRWRLRSTRSATHRLEARASRRQRPRQRGAAQAWRVARGHPAASRSCATESITIRRCGRSWPRSGATHASGRVCPSMIH